MDAPINLASGVGLRLEGVSLAGERKSGVWKAYTSSAASESLKWELRYIIPSVGFVEGTSVRVWRHLSDNWFRWRGAVAFLGFQEADHIAKSRSALAQASDVEALQDAEQEHWASTRGVVALLLHWATRRRRIEDRNDARLPGSTMMAKCTRAEVCEGLLGWRVPAGAAVACQRGRVALGLCGCMTQMLQDKSMPDHTGKPPQVAVWDKLVFLMAFSSCGGVRAWVRILVCSLSDEVEQQVESWGGPWVGCASELQSAPKRRRVDHHIKQHVLQTARNSAPTLTAAGREIQGVDSAQCLRWAAKEMSAYRANTMLDMTNANVVGVTCDAARVGKPAREFLSGYFTDPMRDRHGALPAQVLVNKQPNTVFQHGGVPRPGAASTQPW